MKATEFALQNSVAKLRRPLWLTKNSIAFVVKTFIAQTEKKIEPLFLYKFTR